MGDQLTIDADIVILDRGAECRNIDGNVDDAKKGKCKHGGYSLYESNPINAAEFC